MDINNIIQQVFQHANYSKEDIPLMESFSFNEVKKAFEESKSLVQSIIREDHSEGDEENPKAKPKNDKDDDDDGDDDEEGNKKKKNGKKNKGKKSKDEEEDDDKKDKKDSGDLQEEEVEESEVEEEEAPENIMSDEEVRKAIKSLSDIVNGVDIEDDKETN